MRVSELAKELEISVDDILKKLKSLHMKAKGKGQDLSGAAVAVLRREFEGGGKKKAGKSGASAGKEQTGKKSAVSTEKKVSKAKPKTAKESVKKKAEKSREEPKEKKVAKKKAESKAVTKIKRVKKKLPPKKKPKKALPKKKEGKEVRQNKSSEPESSTVQKEQPQPKHEIKADQPTKPAEEKSQQQPSKFPEVEKEVSLKEVEIPIPIAVKDLAVRIQEKPSLILKELMKMGIFVNINQALGEDILNKIADKFHFKVSKEKTKEEKIIHKHRLADEDTSALQNRPPVITFMGHVDHGKTSLLDKIRKSKLTDKEHGGITQHIGAYSVPFEKGSITFLDTPGHEAFTSMRARGAHITDLIILVIAADEGVMPQTEEAIDHARAAQVPIVVALNKIDKRNADPDRVKKQLADRDLNPEEWGGKTIVVGVSAITGEGTDRLLEMILLEAELLELKANYEKLATGIIVEAKVSHGKGAIASVVVQNGTLREGDTIIVGPHWCKVKAMFDDHERSIKKATPGMPAEILGLSGVPEAGDIFYAIEDEKEARQIAAQRQTELRNKKLQSTQKVSLEDLYSRIQEGSIKELNLIIKADVQGTLEALKDNLNKISHPDVQIKMIHTGIGVVNASDIILAQASDAIIIGFNVETGPRAKEELSKKPVDIRTYRVIYDAIRDIRNALEGLLEPKKKKNFLAKIEIRQVFKLSKSGIVAGCFVKKGKVHRKAKIDIVRNGDIIYSGTIASLKRFKDDVREVSEGFECGITIQGFSDIQPGDMIEAYEMEIIARTL